MFSFELELGKFLGSLDLIQDVYKAICDTSSTYEFHTTPSGFSVLVFQSSVDYTNRFLKGEFDLVSSEDYQVVDFISTKVNPLFSINKAAVDLFEPLFIELKEIKNNKPLVVTGWGLGGYIAILFTLQQQHAVDLEESNGYTKSKRPICITFGSPLVGDEALERAISERPRWISSFVNVVSERDPVASFFSSNTTYQPFGTFLCCTNSGGHTVFDDQESILTVLDTMASLNAGNIEMHDYGNDLRSIIENVLYRGVSELDELYSDPLRAGIALQFWEVGMLNNITKDMIRNLEENQSMMVTSYHNTYESMNQENQMEISLEHIIWYMEISRPKGGYYDSYKNPVSKAEIDNRKRIVRHHRILNKYWKRIVEEKEQIPQQESATDRMLWLYPGTTYRRMVEPLDIAEHYKMGNTNYKANRDIHYQLLESWSNTEMNNLNSVVEIRNTNLTTYSCFWADVEEFLISLRDLKFGGSGHSAAYVMQEFKEFEADVMCAINHRLLSPDIFLEGSSFMKWWISYKGILRFFSKKMDQNIDTELKHYVSNMVRSSSNVKLSSFQGSIDVLPDAYRAISKTSSAYQLHTNPSGIQFLAFNVLPDYTTPFLNGEFDLVSSDNHNAVEFISTKANPSFSINKAAVYLFEHLILELSPLENQLTYKPLVVTGRSLGGYLAILFSLWLQHAVDIKESNGYTNIKRPVCVTFGSPLVGDGALQRAISERPQWKSTFLNVIAKKDPVASFFSSNTSYKPFGTFLFCTKSGGHTSFENQEAILAVLDTMASLDAGNAEMHDYGTDLRVSELGDLYLYSLRAEITLQMKKVVLSDKSIEDVIGRIEQKRVKKNRRKNIYEPLVPYNELKISLAYMEWYMKTSRSKGGYYDSYKTSNTREEIERQQIIIKCKIRLNQFWKKFVEEKYLMPQQEHARLRKRWLYSGTTYRRIVEPLEIADHYKKGNRNYFEHRPRHYQLLEILWSTDQTRASISEQKRYRAASLTYDSCFWMHVEEALISLRDLKDRGFSENLANIVHGLEEFEAYLMLSINTFSVSPDIFVAGSSFMKWWNEYNAYRGSSYVSEFAQYMNSESYLSYQ